MHFNNVISCGLFIQNKSIISELVVYTVMFHLVVLIRVFSLCVTWAVLPDMREEVVTLPVYG